jgi:dipeptidyl aminopeptidase/acylaminoacyl peptidase
MKHKGLWLIAGLGLVLLLFYGAASWVFSSLIIAAETQSVADAAADGDTPADFGLPEPEEVSIEAAEVELAGWYFDNPANGECGLLFLHGFRGTRYHALNWARLFWERGCDVLAYDHRGHGDSTPAFHTYGYHEKEDAMAALDWLAGRAGLERSQIGVFGVSYGAATALQMAPLTPDIAFIGADSAYSDLEEIVRYQADELFPTVAPLILPGALRVAEWRANFDVQAVAPERSIAETQVPVLLVHSLTDEYTFSTHSEDIYANSDQSRTVLELTDWGAPHGRSIITDPAAYEQVVDEFLDLFAPGFGLDPSP